MSGIDALRRALSGSLVEPHHRGYAAAARAWNTAVEQRPWAVVDAASVADVVATVRFARRHGLAVAVQPTGHGATGHSDQTTILLRTSRLDTVHVDNQARTARVGAGVCWGQVLTAARPHGLTGLAGSSPMVNVAGYLLGGGLSWFSRRHGWASDSLRAVELVDADGAIRHLRADNDHGGPGDRELLWALRGGGGGLGVITALEIDLYPAAPLFGGRVLWPIDHAPDVLEAYRRITTHAPDELTVWIDMLRVPGTPAMIAADTTYLGTPQAARELLEPLDAVPGQPIADNRSQLMPDQVGSITAEPTDPVGFRARTELLTSLPDQVLEALCSVPCDALFSVRLRHLAGALTGPTGSAPGPLSEPFLLSLLGDPTHTGRIRVDDNQAAVVAAVANHVSGRRPFTYLSAGDTPADALPADALQALRRIKLRHDPDTVFRSNFDMLM